MRVNKQNRRPARMPRCQTRHWRFVDLAASMIRQRHRRAIVWRYE